MDLQEILDSVGLTRTQLAKLMGVPSKTVVSVTPEVLRVIDKYRHSDRGSQTIPVPEIAQGTGIKVCEFRLMIQRLVDYCKDKACTSASLA